MTRVTNMHAPRQRTLTWKIAIASLGFALACASIHNRASAADEPVANAEAVADFSSCAKPVWPEEALAGKHTGAITMTFLISGEGTVMQSRIVKSSGYRELDRAALLAFAKCTYKPGQLDGKPTEAWLMFRYVWSLD